jgi:endonuclease/exonuclease/phosphatase (EEP) superfamily protein YafD
VTSLRKRTKANVGLPGGLLGMHLFLLICRYLAWTIWWLWVAALGLLTLGGFFARLDFFWEVACHFRVQYFWLLSGTTLAPLVFRRWKFAAVPAVLAAVNLAVIAPLYFGGSPAEATGRRLRVLSLNVEARNSNYLAVEQLVRSTKPDFVVLIDVTKSWEMAMQSLRRTYPYSKIIASPGGSGIALYSRIEPEHVETPNMGLVARPLIIGSFRIDERPLTIIAAHTRSPRSPEALDDRNHQFVELARLVQNTPGEVMLIGDLNSTSWSPDFAELVSAGRLIDSRHGWGVQATWPVQVPSLQIPIDHCLVSPGIKIRERRVERAVGSDHYPILVDFSLE